MVDPNLESPIEDRLERIEAALARLEGELQRLKSTEFTLLRLDGLISKIAEGLGINPYG